MRNLFRAIGTFGFFFVYHLAAAYAATEHLPEGYFYQRADVTGDGRDEMIAQPLRAGDEAYVLFAMGVDSWEGVWQRLSDIDPRLAWDSETAVIVVGDYNGDGRDDLYVQGRTAGSPQAILLADEHGQFTQLDHLFSNHRHGLEWHSDARQLLSGDFNGDGRDELLLQGHDAADIHVIFHANEVADFNTSGASWVEGHLGLRWMAGAAELYAGDLNGDGHDDLLWRRKAGISANGDEPAVAMLLANGQGEFDEISQQWEKDFLGAEWDPATHRIELRDVTGDGIADVILIALRKDGTHYLVPGRLDGQLSEVAMRWSGDQSPEEGWANQNPGVVDIVVTPESFEVHAAEATNQSLATQQSSSDAPLFGNEVGTLPGEFSVDPTGAANYRIPIEVPPGVGGMQPDLAFLYSSRAGNGLLGQGWSLSGLSSITRCPRTIAQNPAGVYTPVTYTNTDSFCLDGQLLNLDGETQTYGASGTVYGTEIASFQRIEAKGGDNGAGSSYTGPAWFEVKDKAGLIREYGNRLSATKSRIIVPFNDGNVNEQWLLNRIRDRFGNYIEYTYASDTENGMWSYWPARITWHNRHGDLVGKIELEYEDRPDVTRGYKPLLKEASLARNSLFKRLTGLTVHSRNAVVRKYNLYYMQLQASDASAVTAIEVCDARGSCMPATKFGWSAPKQGLISQDARIPLRSSFPDMKWGDMNGDGRADIIFFDNGEIRWYDIATRSVYTRLNAIEAFRPSNAVVFDYNRDGKDDILLPQRYGDDWVIATEINGTYGYLPLNVKSTGYQHGVVPLDVNNDGYPELLFRENNSTPFDYLRFYKNGPSGFTEKVLVYPIAVDSSQQIIPIEFNGDGFTDFLITARDSGGGLVMVSDGENFAPDRWIDDNGSLTGFSTEKAVPLDVNGDGLTDLLAKGGALGTDPDRWYTFINVGAKFASPILMPNEDDEVYERAVPVQWYRHGASDLLYKRDGHWYVRRFDAQATKWGVERLAGLPDDIEVGKGVFPVDAQGDSVPDLVYKLNGNWYHHPGAGEAAGLMLNVENGLGHRQEVEYWQLNRRDHGGLSAYLGHAPGGDGLEFFEVGGISDALDSGDATYFLGPVTAVAAITSDTGKSHDIDRRIVTTYRYAGSVIDRTGRGFLGFRMVRARNSNTGIETVNLHKQEFPFTGMVETTIQKVPHSVEADVEIVAPDRNCREPGQDNDCEFKIIKETTTIAGAWLSRSDSSFDQMSTFGGVFPYVKTTTQNDYRYPSDSPVIERVTETEFSYLPTGDVGNVTVSIGPPDAEEHEKHVTTTINTYADNKTDKKWCLGRLTGSEVIHRAPGAPAITRTATFDYDMALYSGDSAEPACRLNLEVSNAEDSEFRLEKRYVFDDFGNTVLTQVGPQQDGKWRETRQIYDGLGLYPIATINALGHREDYAWDYRFGKKLRSIGPNGLATSWDYDGFGRVIREQSPRPGVYTNFQYEWCPTTADCESEDAVYFVRKSSSAGSNAWSITAFDSLQREVASFAPNALNSAVTATRTLYDTLGRAYATSLPYERGTGPQCWRHVQYDLLGRPLVERTPANEADCTSGVPQDGEEPASGGNRTTYIYDGPVTIVTSNGRKTETTKDVAGRVIQVKEGDLTTGFAYDAVGNTTTVTPPGGAPVSMGYDAAGNKETMTDPDMGQWQYAYDRFGELRAQTDAMGNTIEMVYDKLGRMIERTDKKHNNGPVTVTNWIYDAGDGAGIGKLARVYDSTGFEEIYSYNEFGQPRDTLRIADGSLFLTTQTYDGKGRPSVTLYPTADSVTQTGTLNTPSLSLATTEPGVHALSWSTASDHAIYTLELTFTDTEGTSSTSTIYNGLGHAFSHSPSELGLYQYQVHACHGSTCATSAPVQINVTELPPKPPGWFNVEAYDQDFDGVIAVDWEHSDDNDTSYHVYRSDSPTSSFASITVFETEDGYEVSLPEGLHYLEIKACNEHGCSRATPGSNPAYVDEPLPTVSKPTVSPDKADSMTELVQLTWSVDGDGRVDRYYVDTEREVSQGSYVSQGSRMVEKSPAAIDGLSPGLYRFRVRACRTADGLEYCRESSWSNHFRSAVRPLHPGAMTVPSTDSDGNYRISWLTSEEIVPEYRLEQSTVADFSEAVELVTVEQGCLELVPVEDPVDPTKPPKMECRKWTDVNWADISGQSIGKYYYRVQACNQYLCSEPPVEGANPVKVTTPPASITVPATSKGSHKISWVEPVGNVTRYQLQESTSSSFASVTTVYDGTAMSFTRSRPDGTYYYRVRAFNDSHAGGWRTGSNPVVVLNKPGIPSSISVPSFSGTGQYQISWGTATGKVDRYELWEGRSTDIGDATRIYNGLERSRWFSKSSNGGYYYWVRACNASGCGGWRAGGPVRVEIPTPICRPGEPCYDPLSLPEEPVELEASPPPALENVEPLALNETPSVATLTLATAANIVKTRGADQRDFRAMSPMRPADFYRELRRERLRASTPSRAEEGASTAIQREMRKAAETSASPIVPQHAPATTDSQARTGAGNADHQRALAPASTNTPRAAARPVKTTHVSAAAGSTTAALSATSLATALPASSMATTSTSGYRHAVRHVYHPDTGALQQVEECIGFNGDGCASVGQVYWKLDEVDINSAATQITYGNGLVTSRGIDRVNGLVSSINTTRAGASVQSMRYEWDVAGNLTERTDTLFAGGITEQFTYDALYRLQSVERVYAAQSSMPDAGTFHNHYAANGNIECLNVGSSSGCGTGNKYTYHPDHPHAVRTTPASSTPYSYDANGSMTGGPNGRDITWTAFNKPLRISAGTDNWSEFAYDPNRARYKQDTPQATTYYVGALYERVLERDSNGALTGEITHRHHIFAGGQAVAAYTCTTSCGSDPSGNAADGTKAETYYLLRDHLGSVNVVVDGKGQERDRFWYTAWGEMRRWSSGWSEVSLQNVPLTRGYTGHEMLNELGLIHMNGRIYDQHIGRFLSADPFVQFPESTQGYNRYTYVGNNPLSYTDPSGYFSLKGFIFGGILGAINPELAGKIMGVVGPIASVFCGPWYAACVGGSTAVSGYLQGAKPGDALEAGAKAAALAYVGQQMAGAIGDAAKAGEWSRFSTAMAHGMSQGALSAAGGGRFGDGFLGAFAGHMSAPYISSNPVTGTVQAAIIGGTVAKIGGGKFANGAATGAMVHMFNCVAHGCQGKSEDSRDLSITDEQRQLAKEGKVREFWESRKAMGDPVSDIGLSSLDPPGTVGDYLFGGESVNNRLKAFDRVYGNGDLNVDEVRVKLMNAHIDAVAGDTAGVRGLLNPEQIAGYHHEVFGAYGLPSTTFGGTPFTGGLWEANATRLVWCGGCDWD